MGRQFFSKYHPNDLYTGVSPRRRCLIEPATADKEERDRSTSAQGASLSFSPPALLILVQTLQQKYNTFGYEHTNSL